MFTKRKCPNCSNQEDYESLYECGTPGCGTTYCNDCKMTSITFYNPRLKENQTWRGGGCPKCRKSLTMGMGNGNITQEFGYEKEGHYCFERSGIILNE